MARPRKEDALDIFRSAIEQTILLIEARGDFDIPLADVAAAIGCSAPALYGHFRNKDALLRAVHDEGFARLYAGKLAAAAQSEGSAYQRLREGGHAYLRFALENPVLYQLMFSPPEVQEMASNPFETDVGRRALDFLVESIKACQREGYLPGADPDDCAFALWSAVHGAASLVLQNRAPIGASKPDIAGRLVDTIMTFVDKTRSE